MIGIGVEVNKAGSLSMEIRTCLKIALVKVIVAGAVVAACFLHGSSSLAYPPFQEFSEKHSGRTVNCAMCHANDSGPQGNDAGQLGSLNAEELKKVNQARTAMQPGVKVDSPILNKFGNQIIYKIGLQKFLQAQANPATLKDLLGIDSDLDGDGISDAQEYLDGTDPLDKFHGDPAKLFFINLDRYRNHIMVAGIATALITYGLLELLKGYRAISVDKEPDRDKETQT